jgi:cobalamin biosynthesis protein CobT
LVFLSLKIIEEAGPLSSAPGNLKMVEGACRKSPRERSTAKPFKSGKQNSGAKVDSTEQTKKKKKQKKTGGKAKVVEKVEEEAKGEEEEEEEGGEGEGVEEEDEDEDEEGEEEEEGNDSEEFRVDASGTDEDDEDGDVGVDESAEQEAEDCGRKKLQKAAKARKKVHMTHIYGFFCFKVERSPDSALPSADQLYCNA